MTIEEGRRIFDELIQQPRRPPLSQTYSVDRDEEYMAERDWIKKAFIGSYLDGTEQIADRHPEFQRHYSGLWPKRRPRCERYERPAPSAPQELTAGDTSQLDTFLSGFAKKEV